MRHPERNDDQKNPLFPTINANDRDQAGGGGPKPQSRNKMTIYEHQPVSAAINTSQRINTSTPALLTTMLPPPPLLAPPKFRGISPSGSSICYVGGQVPPASAAAGLPFYVQNTATIKNYTLPTLPLLPFSKLDDGQVASISQNKKPLQVSTTRTVDKRHPELEMFQRNNFRNDTTNGSKGCAPDDSVESLYTQRYAAQADALTTSSSAASWQLKQSNHSSIDFGSGSSSNKHALDSAEHVRTTELIRCESHLPKALPVDDIRSLVGVATSSSTPHSHCEYRVPESQTVTNRMGNHQEIAPAESTLEDVTAIIGEDAFLRLRSEMIKHQKQFVEQVFELHRLIAVQRLFARSRTLVESKHKLERPSSLGRRMNPKEAQKGHSVERQEDTSRLKSSSGYASEMFYLPLERKDPFKAPPTTITPRPNQETSAGNPKPANASGINSPWIYPPTGTANHWLVPVYSPSEGLIYKPYPIPSAPSPSGFTPPPIQINPPKPAQTHPEPFQKSGIRPLADIPFCLPCTTPPLPSASAFDHGGKAGSYHHPSTALLGSSFKSSWNFSPLGSGTVKVSRQVQAKQGGGDSTASSSPPGRTQGNILPLFPEEPTAIAMLNKPRSSEQQQRKVIKVVPLPPTSATESTARIIRSIWEERR